MPQPMQVLDEVAIPYPTAIDLFESFSEGMHSLYLHAFLLTADHDQAEECLVWAIRECVEGPGVFMESTRLCIRKAVLKRAIELVAPVPERIDDVSLTSLNASTTPIESNAFAAILSLTPFRRFVFVMSILEGQSDYECAVFLRCSRRDVRIARLLALKRELSSDAQGEETLQV